MEPCEEISVGARARQGGRKPQPSQRKQAIWSAHAGEKKGCHALRVSFQREPAGQAVANNLAEALTELPHHRWPVQHTLKQPKGVLQVHLPGSSAPSHLPLMNTRLDDSKRSSSPTCREKILWRAGRTTIFCGTRALWMPLMRPKLGAVLGDTHLKTGVQCGSNVTPP